MYIHNNFLASPFSRNHSTRKAQQTSFQALPTASSISSFDRAVIHTLETRYKPRTMKSASRTMEEIAGHAGGTALRPDKEEFISLLNKYMLSSVGDIDKILEKELISTLEHVLNTTPAEAKAIYNNSSKTFLDSLQNLAEYSREFVLNNSKYLDEFKKMHEELYSRLNDQETSNLYNTVKKAVYKDNLSSHEVSKIDEMAPTDINERYKALTLSIFNDLRQDPKANHFLQKYFTEMEKWLINVASNH